MSATTEASVLGAAVSVILMHCHPGVALVVAFWALAVLRKGAV